MTGVQTCALPISAERLIRDFLIKHGDHVEAMRLLARIGMKLDVLDDAELLLDGVLRLEPEYRAARHDYAMVLLKRHKHASAREELERLLQADANIAFRHRRRRNPVLGRGAGCCAMADRHR